MKKTLTYTIIDPQFQNKTELKVEWYRPNCPVYVTLGNSKSIFIDQQQLADIAGILLSVTDAVTKTQENAKSEYLAPYAE